MTIRARSKPGRSREPSKSHIELLLQSWAPPIIAGLLAVAGGFFLATKSETAAKEKTYLELKLKHADEAASAFADYTSTWRRLKIMCESLEEDTKAIAKRGDNKPNKETKEQISIVEQKRKSLEDYARLRPQKRDRLLQSLAHLKLYFSLSLIAKVDNFVSWDVDQQTKECSEIPLAVSFEKYESEIVAQLRMEITP